MNRPGMYPGRRAARRGMLRAAAISAIWWAGLIAVILKACR